MDRAVIVALDFPNKEETLAFLDQFPEEKLFVKVGMELFYSEGPAIIKEIKSRGHQIFLDLKLHDIPHTVEQAMSVLANLEVDMVNVHAAGTIEMMAAALKGLTQQTNKRPLIIAVTQLTSTDEARMKEELLISSSLEETVKVYAQNAKRAGLDGVVCSPHEAPVIHQVCGKDFLTVTPGIRFKDSQKDDQVRITTPQQARQLGSDFIVVGRPITKAKDPVLAYQNCLKGFLTSKKEEDDDKRPG
ncbi:orotidine-5'-phosphate decarboxylase [Streptococcus sp. CSL7591-lung]|uniref:Orotidine 5'-phosphate decarboxylase n=2 Tax=Streptococcus pacificus TaxID=2740577 RepID=A0ABS0ZIK0_9STRE|nr:orotidine-5'-phosphate decarboxylase [Streptococcus pacificus]